MEEFLTRYGLLAVFFAGALEGDIAFLAAGVLAHLGYFNVYLAAGVGILGVLCGDSAWYVLGRWRSQWVRTTRFWHRIARPVEKLFLRLGPWQLIAARIVYGIRIASMIFWGIQRLPYRRFLKFNACGAAPWGALLTLVGFALGLSVEALMGRVKQVELTLLIGLLIGWTLFVAVNWALRRLLIDEEEPQQAPPDNDSARDI